MKDYVCYMYNFHKMAVFAHREQSVPAILVNLWIWNVCESKLGAVNMKLWESWIVHHDEQLNE